MFKALIEKWKEQQKICTETKEDCYNKGYPEPAQFWQGKADTWRAAIETLEETLREMSRRKSAYADLVSALPDHPGDDNSHFWGQDTIMADSEERANAVADLLDAMGYTAFTGNYDPDEDNKNNVVDDCTGWYYISV